MTPKEYKDFRVKRQYQTQESDDQRTAFQVDRDRIMYSLAFRRLAQVTQVVSASEGSVFHNRLTHSLKVGQVARRLAESLLNEHWGLDEQLDADVVESAALAHDLGHPPFGHIAEQELNKVAIDALKRDGFEGNAQTFRILTRLEPHRFEYPGLNLTRATLDAVLKYPWTKAKDETQKQYKKYSVYDSDLEYFNWTRPNETVREANLQSLEASIMDFADDITYSVHDLEDFYLAGLIPIELLAKGDSEFNDFIREWGEILKEPELKQLLKNPKQQESIRNLLRAYLINYESGDRITKIKIIGSGLIQKYIQSASIVEEAGNLYFSYGKDIEIELKFLQRLVWKYVILNPRLATQQMGQRKIIETLFKIYHEAVKEKKLDLIPSRFVKSNQLSELDNDPQRMARMAVDIVASFTEPEAVIMFRRLTGLEQGSVMDYIV